MLIALACVLATAACQGDETKADLSPLPTAAGPPYVCGHIPLKAVEVMTGVRDPLVRGYFDLKAAGGLGEGVCSVYQRDGEQLEVLQIDLTPGGYVEKVKEQLEGGALPLPEIVPGSVGYYFKPANSDKNDAYSMLVRGKAELNVQLETGVEGRDSAADVLALMRLIAPKLITDASSPSAKAASPSPENS
ncbi:hypothetical protein ACFY19_17185 [Streptosporangium saharense]|uniref:hypothetical protein n=1 Tax=Streptosporangium saharense TaxID=1706840 RepID=UPI0036955493